MSLTDAFYLCALKLQSITPIDGLEVGEGQWERHPRMEAGRSSPDHLQLFVLLAISPPENPSKEAVIAFPPDVYL